MRLLAALSLAFSASASAVPIVDQEAMPAGGSTWHDNDTRALQTFTVSTTGELTRIDLLITENVGFQKCVEDGCRLQVGTPPAVFESGNYFDYAAPLSTAAFFEELLPGWFSVVFDTPLHVKSGQLLGFLLDHHGIVGIATSSYGTGSLIYSCGADPCIDPFSPDPIDRQTYPHIEGDTVFPMPGDYAFRVWIDPNTVPEPGLAVLLAIAAGLITRRAIR